jgi:hypothetical protein
MSAKHIVKLDRIESMILTLRGLRVMLDSDLAAVYGVTTGQLNQALKRKEIGFHIRETATPYKVQSKKRF